MRLLLKGFYGMSNLGDDLILARFVEWAEMSGCDLLVCISSSRQVTEELSALYPGCKITEIEDRFWSRVVGVWRSEAVVVGGGGLFPSGSGRELLSTTALVVVARLLARPVSLVGIGLNPAKDRLAIVCWKIITRLSKFVATRDKRSTDALLSAIGKPETSKVIECADVVASLNLTKFCGANDELLQQLGPVVVFALANPWSESEKEASPERYEELLNTLAKAVETVRSKGVAVVLVPFFLPGDLTFARNLAAICEEGAVFVEESPNLADRVAWFSQSTFVVTMRFHGLVLAACTEKPACVVAYDHKLESLAEDLNLTDFVVRLGIRESAFFREVCDIDRDKFIQSIDRMACDPAAAQQSVNNAIGNLRVGSKRNFEALESNFGLNYSQ